jgi:hypothetical protein
MTDRKARIAAFDQRLGAVEDAQALVRLIGTVDAARGVPEKNV